jgi:hypothetical protein
MFTSIRRTAGLVAILALGGAAALAFGVAPGGAARASNSVTYQDSTGEDPGSLDIQQVVVSNDDNGLLTFAISMANAPALTGNNDVSVLIDSDNNPNTGATMLLGMDMLLDVSGGSIDVAKWNGSTFAFSGSPSSLVYSFAPGLLTIKVNASDLGLTTFNFLVLTDTDFNDPNSHVDLAPDPGHGTFAYQVKIAPPVTTTTTTTTTPTTTVKKKVVPKCKKGHKSTKKHPCHK